MAVGSVKRAMFVRRSISAIGGSSVAGTSSKDATIQALPPAGSHSRP
jgi:hypothetical protein